MPPPRRPSGIVPDLVAAEYHKQKWAVSNSDLKVFSTSPAHYAAMLSGAPEDDSGMSEDDRKARVMGTLIHAAVLENRHDYLVKPAQYHDTKLGTYKPWNGNAAPCREWMEAAESSGVPVISARECQRIKGAKEALLAHPVAGPLLTGRGQNEVSVFVRDAEFGVDLRMRADRLTEDAQERPWIVDLKSCQSVRKFAFTAREFRYDVQAAFYSDVMALAGVPNAAFCFIAFELAPRYGIHAVRVVMPDHETLTAARATYRRELEHMVACQASNTWPTGNEEIEYLTVKRWNA